ncbi:IclR family transcriptional regulator domain-containing protein [Shouchella tritolerans]|uniref:IclR family transcriptional regulator domain-containing protein n=1 Tax=Shouchella tritolerans TaxID=2979466 RepID=UPI00384A5C7C
MAGRDKANRFSQSVNNQEITEGIRCIACPIMDYTDKTIASFSMSGPLNRLTNSYFEHTLIAKMLETKRSDLKRMRVARGKTESKGHNGIKPRTVHVAVRGFFMSEKGGLAFVRKYAIFIDNDYQLTEVCSSERLERSNDPLGKSDNKHCLPDS